VKYEVGEMTIAITGPSETPPSDQPDALQQDGVQAQGQASDTMVPITEVEVALGTAAATGLRRKERRWVALLGRIFVAAKESRPKPRPYRPSTTYLERANGTRDAATVSPLAIASAPALTLVTAMICVERR
jgi:hypothetical protein